MSGYFSELKPYINKLSELNILGSLRVIRAYFFDSFPCYDIKKPDFSGIENPQECKIPPYFIDFLIAVTLKYSTTCRSQKSLSQYSCRVQFMRKLDEVYNKVNKELFEDITVGLKSYVFSQYNKQNDCHIHEMIYKCYYLYSGPLLSQYIQNTIGVTIEQYITIVISMNWVFSHQYSCKIDEFSRRMVGNGKEFTEKEFDKVLSLFLTTLHDIRDRLNIDFSNTLFLSYNNSLHVCKPIIKEGDSYYCPIPIYILKSGFDGLQYTLNLKTEENKSLNKEVSKRFEDYVGDQLDYYASKDEKFEYVKEVVYNKTQNKSSDWIVYDEKCVLFIDCKLKKLTIDAIAQTTLNKQIFYDNLAGCPFSKREDVKKLKEKQDSALAKDLIELGVDLGKILCCYVDWVNGKILEFPKYSEEYNIMAIVLTLEETFVINELKGLIDEVARRYVKAKKGFIPKNIKTSIISSSTFDASIPIIAECGIYNHVFKDEFEYKDDGIINTFLENKFDDFNNKKNL